MKKKIGAILAAGLMTCMSFAGMIGCGPRNRKKVPDFVMPEGGFDTTKQVEITFYHTMGQSKREIVQEYIAEFNEMFPNIKVTDKALGKYEDVRDQVVTEINAGNQPNISYCYPDHVALFNQANAVLPLNDFLPDGTYNDMTVPHADGTTEKLNFTQEQKESFFEAYYNEGYQFGDGSKMYTLPFAKSTEVLYYNYTYFDAHKSEFSVPTTWTEMETVCQKIKTLEKDKTPLGYDSEANWFITMCEQYGSPYTSSTGTKYLFDNATNRAFVKKFKDWFDNGYLTTQEINGTYTSNLFKESKIYMCIGSSAGASYQMPGKDNYGEYKFEVGIAPIPQVDPANPKVISQGPSICIFKNEDPQKVLASWLLAKFLTTCVDFQAEFSFDSGYAPVIKTATENELYQEGINAANGFGNVIQLAVKACMEQSDAYYTSPAFVGSSKARDEVGALMQAVFKGTSIDTAFKNAIEECEYFAPSKK